MAIWTCITPYIYRIAHAGLWTIRKLISSDYSSSETVLLLNFKMIQFCCLSSEALKKSKEVLHLASSLWGNLWYWSCPSYKLTLDLLPTIRLQTMAEHCTCIAEVMGLNPIEASEFFLGFLCNCLSCFTTVQCIYKIYIIYIWSHFLHIAARY